MSNSGKKQHKDKKRKSKNKKRRHGDDEKIIEKEGKKKRRYDSSDSEGEIKQRRYDSSDSDGETKKRRYDSSDSDGDVKKRKDDVSKSELQGKEALNSNHAFSNHLRVSTEPLAICSEIGNADVSTSSQDTAPKKISKLEFFASLKYSEDKKGVVGTVHARGKRDNDNVASAGNPGDWTCPKCSTSNFKNSNQCQKCHALKRITQYR
jgi:hypothetical protein